MKVEDFVFDRVDAKYGDYWFRIVGDTEKELTNKYMEQSMIGVTDAVFSIQDGQWGIRRQFPFNYDVIAPDDKELYELVKTAAFARQKEINSKKVGGDIGHMTNKELLLYYIANPEEAPWAPLSGKRNSMGCSESWYDPFFAMSKTFTIYEIVKMSDSAVDACLRVAEAVGDGLY